METELKNVDGRVMYVVGALATLAGVAIANAGVLV